MHNSQQYPFFVYGTLLPGQPNAHCWGNTIRARHRAALPGCRLYDLGYYPMLLEQPAGQVMGQVIEIDPRQYELILQRVDALEDYQPDNPHSSPYRRVRRVARMENDQEIPCWVYIGRAIYARGLAPIPNGDWLSHAAGKKVQLQRWWREVGNLDELKWLHLGPADDDSG